MDITYFQKWPAKMKINVPKFKKSEKFKKKFLPIDLPLKTQKYLEITKKHKYKFL